MNKYRLLIKDDKQWAMLKASIARAFADGKLPSPSLQAFFDEIIDRMLKGKIF